MKMRRPPGTVEETEKVREEGMALSKKLRDAGIKSSWPEQETHPEWLEVDRLWRESDRLSGYFRLNIWGMSKARDELTHAGVIHWSVPSPDWPEHPSELPDDVHCDIERGPDGLETGKHIISTYDPETGDDIFFLLPDELIPVGDAYVAAMTETRDGTHEFPGIPGYKLGSNDGWLVQPLEITSGIKAADKLNPKWRDGLSDYVLRFVEYMEAAVPAEGLGGFRVW